IAHSAAPVCDASLAWGRWRTTAPLARILLRRLAPAIRGRAVGATTRRLDGKNRARGESDIRLRRAEHALLRGARIEDEAPRRPLHAAGEARCRHGLPLRREAHRDALRQRPILANDAGAAALAAAAAGAVADRVALDAQRVGVLQGLHRQVGGT